MTGCIAIPPKCPAWKRGFSKERKFCLPLGEQNFLVGYENTMRYFRILKWLPVVKTAYRKRMLACYTRFVLVTIYICRSRGSTKRVFSKAVSLLRAIFNIKSSIIQLPCKNSLKWRWGALWTRIVLWLGFLAFFAHAHSATVTRAALGL